jgi:hypothetical protein
MITLMKRKFGLFYPGCPIICDVLSCLFWLLSHSFLVTVLLSQHSVTKFLSALSYHVSFSSIFTLLSCPGWPLSIFYVYILCVHIMCNVYFRGEKLCWSTGGQFLLITMRKYSKTKKGLKGVYMHFSRIEFPRHWNCERKKVSQLAARGWELDLLYRRRKYQGIIEWKKMSSSLGGVDSYLALLLEASLMVPT